jgi:hypothetical protein
MTAIRPGVTGPDAPLSLRNAQRLRVKRTGGKEMVLTWLAKRIVSELENDYLLGDIDMLKKFIEKKELDVTNKCRIVTLDDYIKRRAEHKDNDPFEMFERGIKELESALVMGDEPDPINLKYAYLNLIEAYILFKNEGAE